MAVLNSVDRVAVVMQPSGGSKPSNLYIYYHIFWITDGIHVCKGILTLNTFMNYTKVYTTDLA